MSDAEFRAWWLAGGSFRITPEGRLIRHHLGETMAGDLRLEGQTREDSAPTKRPKCVWPITLPIRDAAGKEIGQNSPVPCGSEADVFKVKGSGKYTGRVRESDICRKHLPDAIKSWDYESAVPISDVGGRR